MVWCISCPHSDLFRRGGLLLCLQFFHGHEFFAYHSSLHLNLSPLTLSCTSFTIHLSVKRRNSSRGGRPTSYYEEHAHVVRLSAITSCSENATVIQMLQHDDLIDDELIIKDAPCFNSTGESNNFIINQEDDLGWLGYFIGKSETLQKLTLQCCWPDEKKKRVEAADFARGIYSNQSIQKLEFCFPAIATALPNVLSCRDNSKLTDLHLNGRIEGEVASNLALALGGDLSLKVFALTYRSLNHDSFDVIIEALISQTQLERLHLCHSDMVRRRCEKLGDVLVRWRPLNLRWLRLDWNGIDDDDLRYLIPGISRCSNLSWLGLEGNGLITSAGLRSLFEEAAIRNLNGLSLNDIQNITDGLDHLAWGLPNFQALCYLGLGGTNINDQELQRLSPGIATCLCSLKELDLSDNRSLTANGLRSLSNILQSEGCCLQILRLEQIQVGNDEASALANALLGNKSLEKLVVKEITSLVGWTTFEKLLCDTSSINNTYRSNHTLNQIECRRGLPLTLNVHRYLQMNRFKEHVATTKILMHHPVFDMKPFFHWKLKFLPEIFDWFHKAPAILVVEKSSDGEVFTLPFAPLILEVLASSQLESVLESVNPVTEACDMILPRLLSSVYQFVRAMPSLVLDGYCSQDLTRGSRKWKRIIEQSETIKGRGRACSF